MQGKTIDQISLGDRASFEKTITETDVSLFAGLSSDMNPVHMSRVAAAKSRFGERIAHRPVDSLCHYRQWLNYNSLMEGII